MCSVCVVFLYTKDNGSMTLALRLFYYFYKREKITTEIVIKKVFFFK